jgi:hypothetical protein
VFALNSVKKIYGALSFVFNIEKIFARLTRFLKDFAQIRNFDLSKFSDYLLCFEGYKLIYF